ncbi:hypothetical protein ACFPM3_24235 [Streptomyces coeruleoprunus]|uniref:Uncharacterized protein n=1 Tax=Streptomyces coeruleoprunus TaxID=285563 RepID=A0ABV9XNY4_9ACTN
MTSPSATAVEQNATFTAVPGLADSTRRSFRDASGRHLQPPGRPYEIPPTTRDSSRRYGRRRPRRHGLGHCGPRIRRHARELDLGPARCRTDRL